MIHNLKMAWPTKISMPFLSSLDNLLSDVHIIFREGVDNFEIEHMGGADPLNHPPSVEVLQKIPRVKETPTQRRLNQERSEDVCHVTWQSGIGKSTLTYYLDFRACCIRYIARCILTKSVLHGRCTWCKEYTLLRDHIGTSLFGKSTLAGQLNFGLVALLLLLLPKHLYSAPRRTERFTKENNEKQRTNYGNKWVFSCLLNIGKDCDSRR